MAFYVHSELRMKIQRNPTVRLNRPQMFTSVNIRDRADIKLQVFPRSERQRNQSDLLFFLIFIFFTEASQQRMMSAGEVQTSFVTIKLSYC